ncbi:MAG: hypothetical protein KGL40_10255 [Rhodocyclaceae bacterium]|nr:hypothetical protein [Rhodocyclaceae bacterium]
MRKLLAVAATALALCGTPVAHADVMPLPGGPRMSDCAKSRDPARCEARLRARRACSAMRGDTKRLCMDAYMVSPDCAHADNPKRCVVQRHAEQACHGKQGKVYKSCMQAELKKKPKHITAYQPAPRP